MKVEELIGSRVWIKSDQFRSVPGRIESMSNAVNLDDMELSVCQSTFGSRCLLETSLRFSIPRFQRLKTPAKSHASRLAQTLRPARQ
jgi:hypothetical protein